MGRSSEGGSVRDESKGETVVTVVTRPERAARQRQQACLVVIYGRDLGKKYQVDARSLVIGRSSKSDIPLDGDSVSRSHCKVYESPHGVAIRDLGSTNGTFVNDEQVHEGALHDGDIVKVGRWILKFLSGSNVEHAYHEEIYRLTTVDGLTQVYNKRYLTDVLGREASRAKRYARPLSLIMFDIDHFKNVNDAYGHVAGDYVLKQLAGAVSKRIRREDTLARYGGEEFAIVLPELDIDSARKFAKKVHELVQLTVFKFGEQRMPVTISVGVASASDTVETADDLIKAADECLYEAKRQGRDRVCG